MSNTVMITSNESVWTAEEVWAAAACAQRINGSYIKNEIIGSDSKMVQLSNRSIMKSALEDPSQMLAEDFELGRQALAFHSQRLTMKALTNQSSEFDNLLASIVPKTHFNSRHDNYPIAIIASQIRAYYDCLKDIEFQDNIDRNAGYLGNVGDVVNTEVKINKVVWSNKYGTYFLQGMTPTKQAIFFSYKTRVADGSRIQIRGRVKGHRELATQLNRVKIMQQGNLL